MQVDGYELNVYGARYAASDERLQEVPLRILGNYVPNGYSRPRAYAHGIRARLTLIYTLFNPWRPLGGYLSGTIEPGDTLAEEHSFVIRRSRFDTVIVTMVSCYRRRDDTRAFKFDAQRLPDGSLALASLLSAERAHNMQPYCRVQSRREYPI